MHARAMSARKSLLDDAAKDRAVEAQKAADDADDVLVELIRTELQGQWPTDRRLAEVPA